MSYVNDIMNWGMGVGAVFAMAIRKFNHAYIIFAILMAWNLLRNFVSGEGISDFSGIKLVYLFFYFILFFSTIYLITITFKHADTFSKEMVGDLGFYLNTTNVLILFIFFMSSNADDVSKALDDMLENCGDLVLILTLFLFTYLLGVMIVNISIIANSKITDG